MVKCCFCTVTTVTVKLLIKHIQRNHDPESTFICAENNCLRSYNKIDSFRKHLIKNHNNLKNEVNVIVEPRTSTSLVISNHIPYSVDTQEISNIEPPINSLFENNVDESDIENLVVPDVANFEHVQRQVNIEEELNKHAIKFSLSLHNKNFLPRKTVFEIQNEIKQHILEPISNIIKESVPQSTFASSTMINKLPEMFNNICTEFKFKSYIESLGLYESPVSYTIRSELRPVVRRNQQSFAACNTEGMLMPLTFQLKKLFECDGILRATQKNIENLNNLDNHCYQNTINGKRWKNIISENNLDPKNTFPLDLYFDGFGASDSSSVHAVNQSIYAIYYSCPVLPQYFLSKLDNIYPAGFFKTTDLKESSNDSVLYKLIEELHILECEGLLIKSSSTEINIRFILANILGDNLAVHEILGFTKSFNSNQFCRTCKRSKFFTFTDTKEKIDCLRTVENYEIDVEQNDVSLTGIIERSIFNTLPTAHVINLITYDIMHDIYEGCGKYLMQHLFYYFIISKKMFSLDVLNQRKNLFVYGNLNNSNIPNDFKLVHIKNKKLRLTASESKTIITFLPLIIGKCVPETDAVWSCFCNFLKVVELITLPKIDLNYIELMRDLISQHLREYIDNFQENLKPKHHNLVHYPRATTLDGPLIHKSCMRYEAAHKIYVQYSRNNASRINLPKSLSIKAGLKFANSVLNNSFFMEEISADIGDEMLLENQPYAYLFAETDYGAIKLVSVITKKSLKYFSGSYFYNYNRQIVVELFEIVALFYNKHDELIVIANKFNLNSYDNHLQSFEIETTNCETIVIKEFIDMLSFPCNLHTIEGKKYLRKCKF